MKIQGSAEWLQDRLGKVTASRIVDVMAKGRGDAPSATRKGYLAQIVAERLSGRGTDSFSSAAMQHGTDTEPQARACYMLETGLVVQEVGFIPHPTIPMCGASPDGLIGTDGGLEIKCPNTGTHIETLMGAEIDGKYMKQMQWGMACTGRLWWDFASFDPRMPDEMQLHIRRVPRSDALIGEIVTAVEEFQWDAQKMVDALRARFAA